MYTFTDIAFTLKRIRTFFKNSNLPIVLVAKPFDLNLGRWYRFRLSGARYKMYRQYRPQSPDCTGTSRNDLCGVELNVETHNVEKSYNLQGKLATTNYYL